MYKFNVTLIIRENTESEDMKEYPSIELPFIPRKGDILYLNEEYESWTVKFLEYNLQTKEYSLFLN